MTTKTISEYLIRMTSGRTIVHCYCSGAVDPTDPEDTAPDAAVRAAIQAQHAEAPGLWHGTAVRDQCGKLVTRLVVESPAAAAHRALSIAMAAYAGYARRPRSVEAWSACASMLWLARQDAVAAGILQHGTDAYELVSARYRDADIRRSTGRAFQAACPREADAVRL